MSDIDWTDLQMMTEDPNRCGGPNDCEGRKYDPSKEDCQKCMHECKSASLLPDDFP